MKYIIFLILVYFLFVPVEADFSGNWTPLSGTGTSYIPKIHGAGKTLLAYEDIDYNPFQGQSITLITVTTNGRITNQYYTVGKNITGSFNPVFQSGHALYKNMNSLITSGFIQESSGVFTQIQLLQNTYTTTGTGVIIPQQSIRARKYYKVNFNYDATIPQCDVVSYFSDQAGTQLYNYTGGWLNQEKYYSVGCNDPETGCRCQSAADGDCFINSGKVYSEPQLLAHKTYPVGNFFNNVGLHNSSCIPPNPKTILYDKVTPRLNVVLAYSNAAGTGTLNQNQQDFGLNLSENRDYGAGNEADSQLVFTRKTDVNILAGRNVMLIGTADLYDETSVYGTSGIKSMKVDLYRYTTLTHTPLGAKQHVDSCSFSRNFGQFNPNGNTLGADLKGRSIFCNEIQKSGRYEIIIYAVDWAGNSTTASSFFNVYPSIPSIANSDFQGSQTPISGNVYSNNIDSYNYTLTLRDGFNNPIYNKNINSITQNINGYNGGTTIFLNQTTQQGVSAFRIVPNAVTTDTNGRVQFKLYSYTPGTFTQRFKLDIYDWKNDYSNNLPLKNTGYVFSQFKDDSFSKPFIPVMTGNNGEVPQVGRDQKYNIELTNIASLKNFTNGKINVSNSNSTFSTNHIFDRFTVIENAFTFGESKLNASFSGTIQPTSNSSVLTQPTFSMKNIPVSYTYAGKNISYFIDTASINGCNLETVGVKVYGTIQGEGKSNITGQDTNISDISVSTQRNKIRENVYKMISGMKSGTVLNGVKYVEGDISISGDQSYETLIVKNGNIFISGNLNTSGKKLGLITILDTGYKLDTGYNQKGNIYVKNTVSSIIASIYTDGTFRSADASGNAYNDNQLMSSLNFKGVLFTRNTIGGAIAAGGNYVLPGGGKTTDFSLAEKYDFNFVRKVNLCVEPYSFYIEYNPAIQQDPPKGFSQ